MKLMEEAIVCRYFGDLQAIHPKGTKFLTQQNSVNGRDLELYQLSQGQYLQA